jgi:Leu/Phe-tRNA-protein transferase
LFENFSEDVYSATTEQAQSIEEYLRNKDFEILLQRNLEKMLEGCANVKEDESIHKDAKDLATQVIIDCNYLLSLMNHLM